jgi:hypothetical protein
LAGGQQHGQWFLALFAGQVHLGGQPAPGAAQSVIGWFGHDRTGWLFLLLGLASGTRGVLVCTGDRGIH